MSDSPQSNPKDVEPGDGAPEDQMNDPQDPHSSGLTYEFEVKEQDRWLPIANGMSYYRPYSVLIRVYASLPKPTLRSVCAAWRQAPWLAVRRFATGSGPSKRTKSLRLGPGSMSHDSPSPRSPGEAHGSSSNTDKYDVYDANIRNFAPVARIMKNALPENAKIAKEAKECMQECVSEFISFITSEGIASPLRWFPRATKLTARSLRKMSPGEEEDGQWRGHLVCHDVLGLRELRRSTEDLPLKIP